MEITKKTINDNIEFYKKNENDKVWWIEDPNDIGTIRFSFDKRKIYFLYMDYPNNLSKEEKQIFDEENPYWKDFFKDRI